ncbi:hypothetical protein GCM10007067_13920 [Lysobacter bugurensis]|uniref:Uncharacterized protein n=1 Tax=Cognatilysobacter bugurensis TaxID=543356 RepID=A0A918W7K0_9GAMM|nr:hypothetical protein GCM10007067_13920 [Lysobacter bugurensis]
MGGRPRFTVYRELTLARLLTTSCVALTLGTKAEQAAASSAGQRFSNMPLDRRVAPTSAPCARALTPRAGRCEA